MRIALFGGKLKMLDKRLTLIQKHISIVAIVHQTGLVPGTLNRKLRISQTHIFGPYGPRSLAGESSIKGQDNSSNIPKFIQARTKIH